MHEDLELANEVVFLSNPPPPQTKTEDKPNERHPPSETPDGSCKDDSS